jgi:hypothetical protein
MTESALTTTPDFSIYRNEESFDFGQRMAKSLCQSDLVPQAYQGQKGLANCLIAIETANRLRISPLMVMQNTNIIQGKPSWSAQFIIATITGCGRFEDFDYEEKGTKAIRCRAIRKKDGKEVFGAWVTMDMAQKEGWTRNSKWQTMPQLMLRYRAATFFGRQYVADLLLGLQTEDEIVDIQPVNVTVPNTPHEAAIAEPKETEPEFRDGKWRPPLTEEEKPTIGDEFDF